MVIIRLILGKLILFFNWAFPPKGIQRRPKQQAQIDLQCSATIRMAGLTTIILAGWV